MAPAILLSNSCPTAETNLSYFAVDNFKISLPYLRKYHLRTTKKILNLDYQSMFHFIENIHMAGSKMLLHWWIILFTWEKMANIHVYHLRIYMFAIFVYTPIDESISMIYIIEIRHYAHRENEKLRTSKSQHRENLQNIIETQI